jgi:hypothetical protein
MARPTRKQKGYWVKRAERFSDGAQAHSRAGALRLHESVAHVQVDKEGETYVVSYSVAKWYLENMQKAGIEL